MSLDEEVFENGETYLDLLSQSGFLPFKLNTLNEHIQLLQQQEQQKMASKIEGWIQSDPERKLESCYPRHQDCCHCQLLNLSSMRRSLIELRQGNKSSCWVDLM